MENINTPTPALNYGGEQVWLKTTPPWWWAPPKLVFLRPKRGGSGANIRNSGQKRPEFLWKSDVEPENVRVGAGWAGCAVLSCALARLPPL